jgi:hypothetical protein
MNCGCNSDQGIVSKLRSIEPLDSISLKNGRTPSDLSSSRFARCVRIDVVGRKPSQRDAA